MMLRDAGRWLVVFAAVVLGASLPARGADKERWYVMEMGGQRAGWMTTTESATPDKITTSSRMKFSLSRGEQGVTIEMETQFVETPDGKPVSMKSVQKFGEMGITQEFTFLDDGIDVTSVQIGQRTTSRLARPEGVWLPPAAAERYVLQRYKSGAKEITVRTMDPSNGPKVVEVTRRDFTPEKITVNGREIEAVKSSVEMSLMPGVKSFEWTDAEGELVRSDTQLGGMSMSMVASTKEEATRETKGASPEVMASTFVKLEKPIARARSTTKVVYLVSVPDGELPEIPETGSQKVEKVDARHARVTVTARKFVAAPEGDSSDASYLAATSMCNWEDEKIKDAAAKALQAMGDDKGKRAENLRKFAHRFINKKNLGVGFASASEVARNREGDCSEHGVFLAALLRADGIPSRAVAGLVYVDEFAGHSAIFGYHMWSQALVTIDGSPRWVDLDATLPAGTPYDATHIALGVSALAENDLITGMAGIATVMGKLQIKVESAE